MEKKTERIITLQLHETNSDHVPYKFVNHISIFIRNMFCNYRKETQLEMSFPHICVFSLGIVYSYVCLCLLVSLYVCLYVLMYVPVSLPVSKCRRGFAFYSNYVLKTLYA